MTLEVLPLIAITEGYGVDYGAGAVQTGAAGGSRIRKDISNPSHVVTVSWFCSSIQAVFLMAFKRVVFDQAQPFTASLLVEDGTVDSRTARCLPGSFSRARKIGDWAIYSATLEVEGGA